jgi:hypothetical protein
VTWLPRAATWLTGLTGSRKGLQQAQRQPNRRELFSFRQALVNLQEANYPSGEDAIDKAERTLAVPEPADIDPSTNAGMTIDKLRDKLEQIMKAGN